MNVLTRGLIWGGAGLAIVGIGAVASNDSSPAYATNPNVEIHVNYDCSGRVHYNVKGMVEGDSFSALGTTIFYPKRELVSEFDQPPGEYWVGHIFTHHGEDYHGKRKVEVKKCNSTTTTTTTPNNPTTTDPGTTTTVPSTSTLPTTSTTSIPSTSSTGPVSNTTTTTAPPVNTSSRSKQQNQTKVLVELPEVK